MFSAHINVQLFKPKSNIMLSVFFSKSELGNSLKNRGIYLAKKFVVTHLFTIEKVKHKVVGLTK